MKYNSNGIAQWARSTTAGLAASWLNSISVDSDGDVYAAGFRGGAFLLKYDSSGNNLWTKIATGPITSCFNGLNVDLNEKENIYAAGSVYGVGVCDFGNGVSINGTNPVNDKIVFVKFDSAGDAHWATTTSTVSSSNSAFTSLALDGDGGRIYAGGIISGNTTYDLGNNVTVAGAFFTGGNDENSVVVKYFLDDPPIITEFNKFGNENGLVEFTGSDFINNFSGYLNSNLVKIKIIGLPSAGTLKLSGIDVNIGQEIAVEDLDNLTYKPDTNWLGSDRFDWIGSDGIMYSAGSVDVVVTISEIKDPTNKLNTIIGIASGGTAICAAIAGILCWLYK